MVLLFVVDKSILLTITLFFYLAEFFGAPNFFRRAENFIRIFGTPKIFWARRKKIRRAENILGTLKKIRRAKNISSQNWACRKLFCRAENGREQFRKKKKEKERACVVTIT